MNKQKQLQSVEHIRAILSQLPGRLGFNCLESNRGKVKPPHCSGTMSQVRKRRQPASQRLFSGDTLWLRGIRVNGGAGGEGLQVVQRSYFIVPSINRDPTQSGEPLKKRKPRHGRGTATVLRLQTENRLKQLHVFFTTSRPRPANSFFFFFFFLSTRISRWVTALTTFSVTRHVHILKKENHTVAHSI